MRDEFTVKLEDANKRATFLEEDVDNLNVRLTKKTVSFRCYYFNSLRVIVELFAWN
jgi:hypothetical protein